MNRNEKLIIENETQEIKKSKETITPEKIKH